MTEQEMELGRKARQGIDSILADMQRAYGYRKTPRFIRMLINDTAAYNEYVWSVHNVCKGLGIPSALHYNPTTRRLEVKSS